MSSLQSRFAKAASLHELWLSLQLLLLRWGWPRLVLGLLVSLLLWQWAWMLPRAEQARAGLQQQLAQRPRHELPQAAAPSSGKGLQGFEAGLGSDAGLSALMAQIWRPTAGGPLLSKLEIRRESDAGGRFERMRLTLPLSGSYPAIRRHVFELMAGHPALALEKLELKRETAQAAELQATVHLVYFLKP